LIITITLPVGNTPTVSFFNFFNWFKNKPTQDLGIDLGTANTLICTASQGIVLNEPSVVAIDQSETPAKVLAVGIEARDMMGRTPTHIKAVRPLREGVIADFEWAREMLRAFILKVTGKPGVFHGSLGRVVVCVPSGVTEVERQAVGDAAFSANARFVNIIEEPMAAAIGAGMPVNQPVGSMIVDIGGGTTEIAVLSLNGIVVSDSLRIAGDQIDENIQEHLRSVHNLSIGERTAEGIKMQLASAFATPTEEEMEVRGINLENGLPHTITINSTEIRLAITPTVMIIVEAIKKLLAITPPEMAADIMDRGIMLTGGGALLKGIDALIAEETEVTVHIARDPLSCVVMGTEKVLTDPAFRKILESTDYDGRY
jgi:rod shape-determining protein MreB and related proteins